MTVLLGTVHWGLSIWDHLGLSLWGLSIWTIHVGIVPLGTVPMELSPSLQPLAPSPVSVSPRAAVPVLLLAGEAMEQGLRDCCRSIRIGKILIQSDEETQRAKVYYAKFPPDIYRRKVLLMYPILSE